MNLKKHLNTLFGIAISIAILSVSIATANDSDISSPAFSIAPETETNLFNDLSKDHWAYSSIEKLTNEKVINGYKDGSFKPSQQITRAEFLKIVLSTFLTDAVTEGPFQDLEDWQKPWVHTAYNLGIVKGYTETEFKPNQPITRAEAIKILVEANNLILNPFNRKNPEFHDLDPEYWAYNYIDIATDMNLISGYQENGKNLFKPKNNLNRAEAAVLVVRTDDNFKIHHPYYQITEQITERTEVQEWILLLNSKEPTIEILEPYIGTQSKYNVHVYEESDQEKTTFNYYEVDLQNGEINPTLPIN